MAGVAAALGAPAVGTLGFVFYESWTGSPGALNMVKGLAAGGVFLAISVATGLRRRAAGRAVDVGYLVASAFIGYGRQTATISRSALSNIVTQSS